MPTCPNGHQSVADDWCEVCGHRMTAPGAPPAPGPVPPPPAHPGGPAPGGHGYGYPAPPPPPPAAAPGYPGGPPPPPSPGIPEAEAPMPPGPTQQTELCPQCRTPREPEAPFCEECRYNFLTQSPTSYAPPAPPPGFLQQAPPPVYEPSRPSQMNRPAEPIPQQAQPHPQQHAHHQPHAGPEHDQGDWNLAPPSAAAPQQPGGYGYPGGPGAPAHGTGWMVTVGPDREYFAAMMQRSGPEGASLNLPAYSPEQQVPLTGQQISVGRRRQSTGEAPDIDLSRPPEDPGVSHQHALLVQQPDGGWAVVDQDSTNGTTINGAEEPIQPFVPVPLREGDRVHVGAWTTLTVRRS
ncbi:FHA domain-containing protein [Streptomyces sp. JJ38]|uniref:FHA domain-containing protein n=1 Tax=Streptomyces sp. JJ38 TaxID=2738128 RepID=UPI001C59EC89|nr:FHA domain-containing protein [Streptomyces sp. JJ38]MBW1599790.1 FHA domain-containing protein [Streptomyces sp. JJ38]